MWFIVGKIGEAVAPLSAATENSMAIQEVNAKITSQLADIVSKLRSGSSGIISAG